MKWIMLLLWNPKEALDWCDAKGNIDHGKVAADIVIFALLVAVVWVAIKSTSFPPMGWGIVLIAGAMGARVFMAFLRSKSVTSSEEIKLRPFGGKADDGDVDHLVPK